MIYLDYAAHTPPDPKVIDEFVKVSLEYPGNPNSSHPLGLAAKKRLDQSTEYISQVFCVSPSEVIYTSGATESNNLAIKGIAGHYKGYGRHIITTYLEHSSITGPISALTNKGYEVDFVAIDRDGQVDLEELEDLLREDTILVSINLVDSEIGMIQPVKEIGALLKKYPHTFFHVDATQGVGKIPVTMENIDLLTFSPHKFHGLTGSGVLIKREGILLEPQLDGGISTTPFRSGTPVLAMAAATEMALREAIEHMDIRLEHVRNLYQYLREELSSMDGLSLNVGHHYSPYILNMSLKDKKPEIVMEQLEKAGYCISGKSACCSVSSPSRPVYALTKSRKAAASTLRVGLSHWTTKEELKGFIEVLKTLI